MKTNVVGSHQKCLSEALLMSTHNICFNGKLTKVSIIFYNNKKTHTLSGAMNMIQGSEDIPAHWCSQIN